MFRLRSVSVLKVKLYAFVAARAEKFSAVLFQETGAIEFSEQIHPAKRFHTKRKKRFTDVKSRKFFSLKKNDTATGARQENRSGAAGGSAANDGHIAISRSHFGTLARSHWPATIQVGMGSWSRW